MTKNIKSIFFVLTLVMLLVTVGSVCAADDTNVTAAVDSSVSDVATVSDTASDTIAAEPVQTTSNDNKVDTKTIEKEDKIVKTSTKTVEISNCDEFETAINNAILDSDNDEYIINIKNDFKANLNYNTSLNNTVKVKTFTLNGNNNKITLNNQNLIIIANDYTLNVNNLSFVVGTYGVNSITNYGTLYANNSNFYSLNLQGTSYLYNSTSPILSNNGTTTIQNSTISNSQNNYKTLILNNCRVNGQIGNTNATLIIDDDCIFDSSCSFRGNLPITNNTEIINYMVELGGTVTIENKNITRNIGSNSIYINGNATLINCYIDKNINNNKNLTLINCTLNSSDVQNWGNLIIDDNCILGSNFRFYDYGYVIINDTNKIYPYINVFRANSILHDLNINKTITNGADMTLNNCTLNSTVYNNGNIMIDDDCIFGEKFVLNGNGTISISDVSKILPYMNTYNGDYTLENITIASSKSNYGNLTFNNVLINSTIDNNGNIIINNSIINKKITNNAGCNLTVNNTTINSTITNKGILTITYSTINKKITNNAGCNLTINNTTINSTITNNGILIIDDSCTIGESFTVTGNGEILTNSTDMINTLASRGIYLTDSVIENSEINITIENKANLTIINSTINGKITNYMDNKLTLNNTTLNSQIVNNGILIIDDTCIIGESFQITGNGQVIINDINKIIPYLSTINGTYNISNVKINKTYTFYGNITLNNCTINARLSNYANLSLIDCVFDNIQLNQNQYMFTGERINLVKNCTFSNNYHTRNSWNEYNSATVAYINLYANTIEDSTFINNENLRILFNDSSVYNCEFKNNKHIYHGRSTSSGDAIVIAENTIINNCSFIKNTIIHDNQYATGPTWGAALSIYGDAVVNNSLFESNSNDLNSSWMVADNPQGGAAISSNIRRAGIYNFNITNNRFVNNSVLAPNTNNNNNEFTLNKQKDGNAADIMILTGSGSEEFVNCIVENNTFTKSTATRDIGSILIGRYKKDGDNLTIRNNSFTNIQSNLETIATNITNKIIENNTFNNCSIKLKEFSITAPEEIKMGETIEINGSIILEHPEFYDENILNNLTYTWYVNGEYTTTNEFKLSYTPQSTNLIVYATTNLVPDKTNTITKTTTTSNNITITPENIDTYILEGELISINPNTYITFEGNFNNIGEIYIQTSNLHLNGENATFTNTYFIIEANNNTIESMNINNTDTSNYIITLIGDYNTIQNNTLIQNNTNEKTAAIKNQQGSENSIVYNTINVTGPSLSVIWEDVSGIANTQGILSIGGENNKISHNDITVQNSTNPEDSQYSTIEAITAPKGTNNTISQNNIYVTGSRFSYGINTLDNVINNKISENNITVTGYRYTNGIQVGNGAIDNIITNNNINLTCLNDTPVDEAAISYGIVITSQGGEISDNNTITQNNITINGAVNYGMEIYTATNTNINNNNITLTGVKSMGIGYAHSPNSTVTNNTIIIIDDSTQPLNSVTEEIQPLNTGIRVQQESNNIEIINNTIITKDNGQKDTTINIESKNCTIKNNLLQSSTKSADESITSTQSDIILENNTGLETIPEIEWTTRIITPQNIKFDGWSTTLVLEPYTKAIFQGTFTNGGLGINIATNNIIIDGTNATFKDTCLSIDADNITIQNANFLNNNSMSQAIHITKYSIYAKQENITIINNTIYLSNNITTYTQWGMEFKRYSHPIEVQYNIENLLIENNTINLYGPAVDPLNIDNKIIPNTAAILIGNGTNITINNNNITLQNTTIPTANHQTNAITTLNTKDLTITNNNINIQETPLDTPINNNNTSGTTTIENNTINQPTPRENILKVDTTTFTPGQTATITASIYYGDEINTTINKGKITFKVNGKTLKDENGKVIYVKVVNGTATIENYLVPEDWTKEGTTIQAVYSGSTDCDKLTSEKTNITVAKAVPTLTTEDVTATAGGKITLKATITDNDKVINTGKIVFKINGKSVKDESGKVIYAKIVNNEVIVNYTLPSDMKSKDYNITAVFICPDYDRLEDTKILTVN